MKSNFVSSVVAVLLLGGALAGIVMTDGLITTDAGADDDFASDEAASGVSHPAAGHDGSHSTSGISGTDLHLCHYEGKTYSEGAKLGRSEDALECHIRDGVGVWERDKDPESPSM